MNYCPACGKKLETATDFCANCGRKLESIANPLGLEEPPGLGENRLGALVIDKADPTFYMNKDGVRVTATRLIIPAKNSKDGAVTYSMANITSIKSVKNEQGRIMGFLLALLGIALIVACRYLALSSAMTIGIVLLVAGLLIVLIMRPTYRLKITSAAGEDGSLKPYKKEEFDRIVMAINEAIIKRG